MTKKKVITKTKAGLPGEAFAIVGSPDELESWRLPHHKKTVSRALNGKLDMEKTVDWQLIQKAVNALAKGSRHKLNANPEEILQAAQHLAGHYRKANKALPDILAALV